MALFGNEKDGLMGRRYQVTMYWAWVFLRLTTGGLPIGTPLLERSSSLR